MVKLVTPHVVVPKMFLFHEEELQATWGVGEPASITPGVQLIREAKVAGGCGKGGVEVLGCGEVEEVVLQGNVLCGAGEAMCCMM